MAPRFDPAGPERRSLGVAALHRARQGLGRMIPPTLVLKPVGRIGDGQRLVASVLGRLGDSLGILPSLDRIGKELG